MGKQGFPKKANTQLSIHDPVSSFFFYIVYPETLCRISENKKLNDF